MDKIQKRFLGINEFAEYLGVQKGTLYVWVCQRKIPFLKIGKLVKFDLKEIEDWLKERRVKEVC